jgi:glycine hydroxymethyltransferase
MALINPGDTIMGLHLPDGGHLTHGWKVSITGRLFNSVPYRVNPQTGRFDYDEIEKLAKKHKPKLIISGATAYPREIDFEAFGRIAKNVGAYHVSDIAHIAGLVVAGIHNSPVPHSDIVSSTTHKTLRGPRGGMLLCKKEYASKVDKSVFPGLQGGPHMHTLTAIAVAMAEADTPEFVAYAKQIVKNAKFLAEKLLKYGFNLVSGGTDNHLILMDLRNKNIPGRKLAKALNMARIVTNCNSIPNDPAPPANPSGLRLGTPAITTRGMKEEQVEQIASYINEIAENIDNVSAIQEVGNKVLLLCSQFPVPDHFIIPSKNH